MDTYVCPQCGDRMSEIEKRDGRCLSCGALLPFQVGRHVTAAQLSERSQPIGEFDPSPRHEEYQLPPDLALPELKISRGSSGETLAVLALLLPLLGQGLALACRFESWQLQIALSWGTIAASALALAVDAAMLGTVDLQGTRRTSPGLLFVGMILLWIVFYPVAFFRRRHFGRPNLGPLALLVAVFFVGAPFVQDYMRLGIIGHGLPTCTSQEVTAMVDDMIRKSPFGPQVQSISGHREISYDPVGEIRKGQCLVKTQAETIKVTYSVRFINRAMGTYQVEVDPILPEDPPPCTDPEVIAILERIIRDGPDGHHLKIIAGHQEIRYDRENKIRHGRCQATMQGRIIDVAYSVRVVDRKTGQFEVQIER
jgi:hypothetical protein